MHWLILCLIGARRLITYRRLPEGELSDISLARKNIDDQGTTADDLNAFRRVVRIICDLVAQYMANLLDQHMLPGHGTRVEKDHKTAE